MARIASGFTTASLRHSEAARPSVDRSKLELPLLVMKEARLPPGSS